MRNLLFLLGLFLLIPRVVFADVRLAVLEFRGVGVSNGLLELLADEARTGIVQTSNGQKIKGEKLIIMTRENMMEVLKDQGLSAEDCMGECEVEIAKNIGADYVISGNLTKIGSLYALVIKLHSTTDNNLLASESLKTKSEESLVVKAGAFSSKVFQVGLGLKKRPKKSIVDDGFQEGFSDQSTDDWDVEGATSAIVDFDANLRGKETKVFVDGFELCSQVPCSRSIPLGLHQVEFRRARYQSWSKSVDVQKKSDILGSLVPTFGFLSLRTSSEDISFLLRGPSSVEKVVQSPFRELELDAGQYTLELNDSCYKGAKGNSYSFSIAANTSKDVDFPTQSRVAGLDIRATDGDGNDVVSQVYVDGQYLGKTPRQFKVPLCSKEVLVHYKEHEQKKALALKEKEILPLKFDFEGERKTNSVDENQQRSMFVGDGYVVVKIRTGIFSMGCTAGDQLCDVDEKSTHKVTISNDFYMMTTEVTQGLYKDVMGYNPSRFSSCGRNCPVESVSWLDAVKMANKLSEREGLESCYQIGSDEEESVTWVDKKCMGWRLPTEAEWEYAARGGEPYRYSGGDTLDDVGWYNRTSRKMTRAVAQKKANEYGLYDMSGNVWEWVWDSWKRVYRSSVVNPIYSIPGNPDRILRGGGWDGDARSARVSFRSGDNARSRYPYQGFRLLRVLP